MKMGQIQKNDLQMAAIIGFVMAMYGYAIQVDCSLAVQINKYIEGTALWQHGRCFLQDLRFSVPLSLRPTILTLDTTNIIGQMGQIGTYHN
ncbi:MAG: hypothetical protein EZS28_023694 [Streblomastix strix]|uniref:Uncharacterized protein n=1 Tax=Streblomastix strix TaxID=222440 RepID=A0A5J4VDZ1_9EUKA|nr:MAG: hypothetical protein EZS28_023694 [Streblomastix strix]